MRREKRIKKLEKKGLLPPGACVAAALWWIRFRSSTGPRPPPPAAWSWEVPKPSYLPSSSRCHSTKMRETLKEREGEKKRRDIVLFSLHMVFPASLLPEMRGLL